VAAHSAAALAIRARTRAVGRKLVIYAFMVAVGLSAGRIIVAAWMFNKIGWTATWLEISHWGPRYEPERIRSYDAGPASDGRV
jgi:hypothetical protein